MSTHEAQRHVEGEVRELIRRSGIDPAHDMVAVRRLVQDAVQDYDDRSLHGGLPPLGDQRAAVHSILAVVAGYGALQQYFDDPTVEEIWINSPSQIFVAREGVAELTTTILTADVLCTCQAVGQPSTTTDGARRRRWRPSSKATSAQAGTVSWTSAAPSVLLRYICARANGVVRTDRLSVVL